MRRRRAAAVLVCALAGTLLVACNKQGVEEPEVSSGALPSLASPADLKEIAIEGTEYSYSPDQVKAPAGKPLSITFINSGGIDHDLTLFSSNGAEVSGSHLHAVPGAEATTIVTLEPGKYAFWCTIPGHREAGMEGTLTVG